MKCRFFKAELCRISQYLRGKLPLLYVRRRPSLLAVAQKLPRHLKWDEDLWKTGLGVRFEAADRCDSAGESGCSESCGEAEVRVSIFRLCPLPVSLPHNRKQVFPRRKRAWSLRNTPRARSYGTANPALTFKTGSGLKLFCFISSHWRFCFSSERRGRSHSRCTQRSARGIWRLVHYLKVCIHICLFIRLHKMRWKIWDLFPA